MCFVAPSDIPFDLANVSTTTRQTVTAKPTTKSSTDNSVQRSVESIKPGSSAVIHKLKKYNIGQLLVSSRAIELTEKEAGFPVSVIKHLYQSYLVLEFQVSNTLAENMLKNVSVEILCKSDKFKIKEIFPAAELYHGETVTVYAVIERTRCSAIDDNILIPTTNFGISLIYNLHDVDEKEGNVDDSGFADEEKLDNVEFGISCYVKPTNVYNFLAAWDSEEYSQKSTVTFKKSTTNNLTQATKELVSFFGLTPCDNSDKVPSGATKHILYLSGTHVDYPGDSLGAGINIICRVRMRFVADQGVLIELVVCSKIMALSSAISGAIFS